MSHPPSTDDALEPIDELDDERESQVDDTVAGVSAWAISIIVHAIALLLLVTVVIMGQVREEKPPIKVVAIDAPDPIEPDQPKADVMDTIVPEVEHEVEVEVAQITELDLEVEAIEDESESEVVSEAKARPDAVSSHETGGVGAFMAIGINGASSGAFGDGVGGRRMAAGRIGATRASESKVEAALQWFARHQSPNGQWDVDGYGLNCDLGGVRCEPGEDHTGADGDVACSAYAVLCYLGAGYDHKTPNRYRKVVRGGIDWLVGMQAADGSFGKRNYEHAIAAMAVIESYAMTLDPKLRGPSERAVDIILARQSKSPDGYPLGWDYTAPKASRQDSSVTGWNVMALKSAKVAGLDVGQGLSGAKRWLEGAWKAANPNWKDIGPYDESKFPYTWNAETGETKHDSRVPMGAVSAVFLGGRQGDPMLESMGNYIVANQLPTSYPCNTYYLYYNTMAIFQLGGDRFATWNDQVRDMLVESQREDGCFAGSWDWAGTEFHGHKTGRLLSTAYNTLCLEVYYRKARVMPGNAH